MKTILINCTGKFCYRRGIFQNTEQATVGVLNKNLAKFTGKHLCQNLLYSKVASPALQLYYKKRLRHICFPVNFVKFLGTPFLEVIVSQNMKAYIC